MTVTKTAKKKRAKPDRPNLLASGDQEALRCAGAGSLSDYAKMAYAEGATVTITPEEAANLGAGFVQDMMRMQASEDAEGEGGGGSEDIAPTLTSLSPNTAVLGDPDLTLVCLGSGFTSATVIHFSDQDEPTTLISDTEVSTGVKPSLGWGAVSVDVYVKNGDLQSDALPFTFTEPTSSRSKSKS